MSSPDVASHHREQPSLLMPQAQLTETAREPARPSVPPPSARITT